MYFVGKPADCMTNPFQQSMKQSNVSYKVWNVTIKSWCANVKICISSCCIPALQQKTNLTFRAADVLQHIWLLLMWPYL